MQLKDDTFVDDVAFAGLALAAGRGFISGDGWVEVGFAGTRVVMRRVAPVFAYRIFGRMGSAGR